MTLEALAEQIAAAAKAKGEANNSHGEADRTDMMVDGMLNTRPNNLIMRKLFK